MKLNREEIENLRNSQDASLSPLQCAAYLPLPGNVFLDKINGYLKSKALKAWCVAWVCKIPFKLCTSNSL